MESYYRNQATICAERAASTTLPNVFDQCHRSETAWLAIAKRAARHDRIKSAVKA